MTPTFQLGLWLGLLVGLLAGGVAMGWDLRRRAKTCGIKVGDCDDACIRGERACNDLACQRPRVKQAEAACVKGKHAPFPKGGPLDPGSACCQEDGDA